MTKEEWMTLPMTDDGTDNQQRVNICWQIETDQTWFLYKPTKEEWMTLPMSEDGMEDWWRVNICRQIETDTVWFLYENQLTEEEWMTLPMLTIEGTKRVKSVDRLRWRWQEESLMLIEKQCAEGNNKCSESSASNWFLENENYSRL